MPDNFGSVEVGWPEDVQLRAENEVLKKELREAKERYDLLVKLCDEQATRSSYHRDERARVELVVDAEAVEKEKRRAEDFKRKMEQSDLRLLELNERIEIFKDCIKAQSKCIKLMERDDE